MDKAVGGYSGLRQSVPFFSGASRGIRTRLRERDHNSVTSHTQLFKDCLSFNQVEVVDAFVEPGAHRV